MNNYKLMETQGVNDKRRPTTITAKNISHAKIIATKRQAFHGTWLHIESENGRHLARKNPHSMKWENTPD